MSLTISLPAVSTCSPFLAIVQGKRRMVYFLACFWITGVVGFPSLLMPFTVEEGELFTMSVNAPDWLVSMCQQELVKWLQKGE